MDINKILNFRFADEELKTGLRIEAAKQNKSMNSLLNEIVAKYLEKNKEVV